MDETDFEPWTAEEVYPACAVQSEDEVRRYIEKNCETAYHPVGTLRMGMDPEAPVTSRLKLRGVEGLWIADASIMPAVTSANTNAPSMMIGYRAGEFIASDM
jgi:choline dehydrogenase